jgi:flagellar basal-body rod modification protein FlgD
MSTISAIGNTMHGANSLSSLTSGDFLQLILTEMTKQDPLQPNDTNALLQQLAAVRSIQSDMDLSTNLQALVSQNEFAAAATLVGKTVSGLDENYNRVTGEVKSISRTQYGTVLTLTNGARVYIGDLDEIAQTPRDNGGEG